MKNLLLTLAAGTLISAHAVAAPGDSFRQNCENPLQPGNSRGVVSPELERVNESTQVLKNYFGEDCGEAAARLAKLTELDLSHVKINSLANFNDLADLKKLWVNGPDLEDVSHLKGLGSLNDLWLIAGKIKSLNGMEESNNLASISIVGESLTDIQSIENLSPTSLFIDASNLTKLDPIEELDSLTSLQLHVKSAEKLPNFDKLHKLQSAWISTDATTDFSNLAGLSSVQDLWISAAQFNSLKPVIGLFNLKSLTVANSKLSSLSDLKDLASRNELEAFHSINNPISSAEEVSNLPNLKYLALVGSTIKNTNFLIGLSQLESLDLSQNPGIDVSNVAQKTSLKSLNLASTGISRTDFLQGLTSLTSLSVPYNQLAAAPELNNLTNLQEVNLSGNRLTNTDSLGKLGQLQVLFLNDNPVGDQMQGLLTTPELEVLGMANTGLSGKPSFPVWKKLKVLDLSYNSINNIFAVGDLKDLERLNLAYNKISNFDPILGIAASGNPRDAKLLPWLYELNSEGNPVPHTQVVPSGYALDALHAIGIEIQLDHQTAEKNYSKVALLGQGSDQVVQDIQCLKVYYHYKHIGVLNSILPAFPLAGPLKDHLTPICNGSDTKDCVKALYGQDLSSCSSFGDISNLSPTIKPIVEIGNTSNVKTSPLLLLRIKGDAKRELQEVKNIRDLINNLSGSQNNSGEAVAKVVESLQQELNSAQAKAVEFLARVDRIRVANHAALQKARNNLQQIVKSAEEGN